MEPVEIVSAPTLEDCGELYRWMFCNQSRRSRSFLPFYGAVAVTLVLPAIAQTAEAGIASVSTFVAFCAGIGLATAAAIGYFCYVWTVRSPRRYFDVLEANGPIRYRFSETNVEIRSDVRRSDYDWTAFSRRIDRPSLHVFVVGDATFVFAIAKRDVQAADREDFERLISRLPRARTLR